MTCLKYLKITSLTIVLAISSIPLFPFRASAISGSEFNASNIIDDSVFFSSNSISDAEIQSFLNAKVPVCDTNGTKNHSSGASRASWAAANGKPTPPYVCLKDFTQNMPGIAADNYCKGIGSGTLSAAQIIGVVGRACGISPKVLLVLLQKEQSLITDDWPWPIQYTKATGMGCPDTSLGVDVDANQNGCYDDYEGFFKQIYYGARQFRRYVQQPQSYNYAVGRNSFIAYQANRTDCGGTYITPQSAATAALYNYTPYQPNAAALANLYGTGDDCSAYGNRNFWRMFSDWFGNTHGDLKGVAGDGGGMSASTWSGMLDLFVRGTNVSGANMWSRSYDYSGWSSFQQDPPGNESVRVSSQIAAVSWGYGRVDLFARSESGTLIHKWYQNTSGWSRWEDLGGCIMGTPTATSWSPNRLDIFAQGCNETGINMYHKWWDNNRWYSWEVVPAMNARISAAPSAVSWGLGRIDIFGRAENGQLIHNWYGGKWYGIDSQGGCIMGQPAVSAWGPGRLDVFAQGCNNSGANVWHKWYSGNVWQPWEITPMHQNTRVTSMLGAVSWGPDRIDIFGRGETGDLKHQWYDRSWRTWESLGGDVAQ